MNPYSIAFAIGYYYGRAFPADAQIAMPPEDQSRASNKGFYDGLAAGRRDYGDVDLPIAAMAETAEAE
jgi:hypothetical protein